MAVVAWLACWQQWELAQLREMNVTQAAQVAHLTEQTASLDRRVHADNRTVLRQEADLAADRRAALDAYQLQALLTERQQTLLDARDIAMVMRIREGSREWRMAIAQATHELDARIVGLVGAPTAIRLGVIAPEPLDADRPRPDVVEAVLAPYDQVPSASTTVIVNQAPAVVPAVQPDTAYSPVAFVGGMGGFSDFRARRARQTRVSGPLNLTQAVVSGDPHFSQVVDYSVSSPHSPAPAPSLPPLVVRTSPPNFSAHGHPGR